MNFLGKEYEKIDKLWDQFNEPKPSVKELAELEDRDPRFAGQHSYDPKSGDSVSIVAGVAHEYTLGHELMHVILRRHQYPHFTFRTLGFGYDTLKRLTSQLESAAIHPVLNQRLTAFNIAVPQEHEETYIQRAANKIASEGHFIEQLPDELPFWALLFVEMTMWPRQSAEDLRKRLDLPVAWDLANPIVQARGLEHGSPERCREFAVEAVKAIDEHMHVRYRQNRTLLFDRIMFPPPPLLVALEAPANATFKIDTLRKNVTTGQYELEIKRSVDGTVCWSQGFPDLETARLQHASSLSSLGQLSSHEFADLCEQAFGAIAVN
jgi:hypothetical protein